MNIHALALASFAALVLAACATTEQRSESDAAPAAIAERQILLTVHQPESLAVGLTGTPSQRYLQRRYGPTPSVERILSQLAREHRLDRVDGWPIQSLDVYCEVLAVNDDRRIEDVIAALAADPRVDLVQPMNLFTTQTTNYDDPYAELQAGAIRMDVEQAHQLATGRGVSIAIIDSAVDSSHPDLRGRVRVARNLAENEPIAHGGEVHGTAIAGIIASAVNNNEGIIGVAPDVSIAALRACWAVTENSLAAHCSTFTLARALEVALSLNPNVINLSLAGPADPLLSRLLDEAIERGIIVVAAQAEAGDGLHAFPASHPNVISAHSSAAQSSTDSAAAPTSAEAVALPAAYRVGAPGTEVLTTTPGAKYAFLTGNSLAAAHTAGVVALLMEREPRLDVGRIAALLTDTTTFSAGSASINACRALERLTATTMCPQAASSARF
jgi:subtilisin family serine protease